MKSAALISDSELYGGRFVGWWCVLNSKVNVKVSLVPVLIFKRNFYLLYHHIVHYWCVVGERNYCIGTYMHAI